MNYKNEIILIIKISFIVCFSSKDITSYEELKLDYCNIQDSLVISNIIKDINTFFKDKFNNQINLNELNTNNTNKNKSKNNKCLINNENFLKKLDLYNIVNNENQSNYNFFNCPICKKKFKKLEYLFYHTSLFHEKAFNNNKIYLCPGDFCRYFNCERYKNYYGITNPKLKQKKKICDARLEKFYKQGCMKMVYGCFADGDIDSYNQFYRLFCNKISCNVPVELKQPSNAWQVIKLILMYMLGFLVFIYLVITWILNNQK